jgi:putative transposase
MIEQTVEELAPIVGTRPACRALGAAPATIYRRRRPPEPRPPRPAPVPARALSGAERQTLLAELHSERFMDCSPAAVWATLLDEGRYLASQRTMYRLLAAGGEVRERRDQLAHPAYQRPELLGPAKWTYSSLDAILDVFSRYCVGWAVQPREAGPIAERLIAQALCQQSVGRDQLTVHADRDSSMTSKPVAFLLADLGVTKTHSRPHTSSDNPYSEAHFKTLTYRPGFPARFSSIEHARAFCRQFFGWYNHRHRHSEIGLMTPATIRTARSRSSGGYLLARPIVWTPFFQASLPGGGASNIPRVAQPESVADRGCGGRKRRVMRDSGPHPQGDPSGCPESRIA